MAQQTFTIAAEADDKRIWQNGPAPYPPTASGVLIDDGASGVYAVYRNFYSPTYYIINVALKWDTSALPDTATITGAQLRVYLDFLSQTSADAKQIQATWTAWTGVAGDYRDSALNDAHAGTALSSFTAGSYYNLVLAGYSTGISKTGTTYLQLNISGNNVTAPTGPNDFNIAGFGHATATAPQLIVDYTTVPPTRIAPDNIIVQTNLTGTVGNISEDPDSGDASWLLAP